jgi:hypothetical protein
MGYIFGFGRKEAMNDAVYKLADVSCQLKLRNYASI